MAKIRIVHRGDALLGETQDESAVRRGDSVPAAEWAIEFAVGTDAPDQYDHVEALPTARNAVETAALHGIRRRSGPETVSGVLHATGTTVNGTRDDCERNDEHTRMTDERTTRRRKRQTLDTELAEHDAVLDGMQVRTDAMDDGIAAAIGIRDTATEAFLPEDRLPGSVTTETRGVVASSLDTLAELRDVRSDEVELCDDRLNAEHKRATAARNDSDEITAAIDRIDDRIDEAGSSVEAARAELDAARSRFTEDLTVLAARFEPFDIDLTPETLGTVIDDRLPERKGEMRASVESSKERIVELSTRTSRLKAEREKLSSVDGGGTCPTCDQHVGSDRTKSDVAAIEEERREIDRRLGAAEQERDELIAGIEELDDLRATAIRLNSFRSERVAEAAGRVEDCEATVADLRADREEERLELAEAHAERERADATIATLEIEIASLEADIDRLQAKTDKGETCLEAFAVVDDRRADREAWDEQLAERRAQHAETEAERASIDAEIEELADA